MKQFLLRLWLVTGLVAPAIAAQRSAAPVPGNRYLFVVDTSASMSRLDRASRQTVFDILYTGLEGRMRAGDTFGIWTFNEQVHAGSFPMQVWTPAQSRDLTARAVFFLKEQRYEKQSQLDLLLPQLQSVIQAVGDVNIFLITDGDAKVSGTPFDPDINAAFQIRAGARRNARKPFVALLAARGGEIVSAEVTIAGEPIKLPPTPVTGKLAQAPAPSNVLLPLEPVPTNEVKAAVAPAPTVTNRVASIVMRGAARKESSALTNSASSPRPLAVGANTMTNPPAETGISNTETAKQPSVPPVTVTALVPSVENKTLALTNSSPTPAAPPKSSPALLPQPIKASARELPASDAAPTPPKTPLTVAAVVIRPKSGWRRPGFFMASAALLLAAGGLAVWAIRRARTPAQASFISRSFERR